MADEKKVSKHDLYEKLWASRDFEINHLWQRSIFLATFIVALFTLYFSALNAFLSSDNTFPDETEAKISYRIITEPDDIPDEIYPYLSESAVISKENNESMKDKPCFQLLALYGICLFGFSFSVLWICMAKGSKYMYERHENGIGAAQEHKGFFTDDLQNEIDIEWYENLWNAGQNGYIPRHGALPLSDYDFRMFKFNGARYSSSKINIAIGYLFVFAWILLSLLNLVFTFSDIKEFFFGLDIKRKLDQTTLFVIFIISLTFIILFLEFILAFIIAYKVLSDTSLNFLDFFILVCCSYVRPKNKPDNRQAKWLYILLKKYTERKKKKAASDNKSQRNDEENDKENDEIDAVLNYQKKILKEYYDKSANRLEKISIKGVLNKKNKKIRRKYVRKLMNHEDAKDVFEISLMRRDKFPETFQKRWMLIRNSRSSEKSEWVYINQSDIVFNISEFRAYIAGLNFNDEPKYIDSRLYAGTRWDLVRAGQDYNFINDPDEIYIIRKRMNAETLYCHLKLNGKKGTSQSLSVDIRISNFPGSNKDFKIHREFLLETVSLENI